MTKNCFLFSIFKNKNKSTNQKKNIRTFLTIVFNNSFLFLRTKKTRKTSLVTKNYFLFSILNNKMKTFF